MTNKLPKFFDKHRICIICEGNEEYEYLNGVKDIRLILLNKRGGKADVNLFEQEYLRMIQHWEIIYKETE